MFNHVTIFELTFNEIVLAQPYMQGLRSVQTSSFLLSIVRFLSCLLVLLEVKNSTYQLQSLLRFSLVISLHLTLLQNFHPLEVPSGLGNTF